MRYVRKEINRVRSVFVAACDAHHDGGYIKHFVSAACIDLLVACFCLPVHRCRMSFPNLVPLSCLLSTCG